MREIMLIELERCPRCDARAGRHCRVTGGNDETRIWPWHGGSAGPGWCHKERRDAAKAAGRIKDD